MKEKMLMRLERDRMRARVEEVELKIKSLLDSQVAASPAAKSKTKGSRKGADSKLPGDNDGVNPHAGLEFDAPRVESFQLKKAFRAHLNSVSCVAFHPRKPVLATVSDDETWKIWSVPNGEAVMSGEGHKDWVSGVDFHPGGTHLATSSGDCTVKVSGGASERQKRAQEKGRCRRRSFARERASAEKEVALARMLSALPACSARTREGVRWRGCCRLFPPAPLAQEKEVVGSSRLLRSCKRRRSSAPPARSPRPLLPPCPPAPLAQEKGRCRWPQQPDT
jgi:hypothetical protein